MRDTLISIVFVVFLFSFLIEFILSWRWSRMFFSFSLPIFVSRIPMDSHRMTIPSQVQLESHFHSPWIASMIFKEIDTNVYGFREEIILLFKKSSAFQYVSLMHGKLYFDPSTEQVVVKGFINWSITCIVVFLIAALILFPNHWVGLLMISLIVFALGYSYSHQADRFSKVAEVSAQIWSSKSRSGLNTRST
jgi:hypothetical protein